MNRQKKINFKAIIDEGMEAVYKKLRDDKIQSNDPIVVSMEGKIVYLDPKTLNVIKEIDQMKKLKKGTNGGGG